MMLEILISIIIGILLGIITGLIPGLHVNSVAAIMLSLSPFLSGHFTFLGVATIIVSMTIAHVFFDFLPSIFLGAPEESTALSVLPGHALLLKGEGLLAFRLAALGCIFGFISIVLLTPILISIIPFIFNSLQPYSGIILILISVFVVLSEGCLRDRINAFSIFVISGIFGAIVLQLNISEPLLPMLSGLFGVSALFQSLIDGVVIPAQKSSDNIPINFAESVKSFFTGIFSGSLISIFPAVGPAQAAVLANGIVRKIKSEAYLIMLGCISSVSAVFALITLYSIGKARNGSIVILSQFAEINKTDLYLLMLVVLISGGIAAILALNLARYFSILIGLVNYRLLSLCTIIFIAAFVYFYSGLLGILVLATSTAIGLLAISTKTGRHNAMGCLTLPVILYYL